MTAILHAAERLPVAVIGGGPVGMTAALGLHRSGVPIVVIEAEKEPVMDQRAASTQPPSMEMLEKLGITDQMFERGLISPVYRYFDRITGRLVAEFDCSLLKDDTAYPFVLQHEQYKLVDIILGVLDGAEGADIRFGTRLVGMQPGANSVMLELDGPDGPEKLEVAYVVGCDGGRSSVRKQAEIAFEGFTYPEKFIKIGTYFDFLSTGRGYVIRNYFSDPDEWCNLFKVKGEGPPGIWRAIFPSRVDESDEEALDPVNIERRLQKFFPADAPYEIAYKAIYQVNQRVAETFNKGRVLLAGDACHVNNPIGGMGMNGGIHDACNLYPRLAAVWHGAADASELDAYTRQRRQAQTDFVQAQTIANKKQLEERDPAARQRHLDQLSRTAGDPKAARAFLTRSSLIDSVRAVAQIA